MDVVAFLSPPLLSHLKIVLAHGHAVRAATEWREVLDFVRRCAVDAVIVDPQVSGASGVEEIRALRERHPTVPVVIYMRLMESALRAMVELARDGVEHVVLHRFDDEPQRFIALLEQLPGVALSERLRDALAVPLGAVPLATARAIERLLRSPHRFNGAESLASAAGVTVRQLYRQLESAGFASPRWLVQGARVLRAFAYLQDRGHSVVSVAAKLGYSQGRVLSRQMEEMVGMRPTVARQQLTGDELVLLLARRLQAGEA